MGINVAVAKNYFPDQMKFSVWTPGDPPRPRPASEQEHAEGRWACAAGTSPPELSEGEPAPPLSGKLRLPNPASLLRDRYQREPLGTPADSGRLTRFIPTPSLLHGHHPAIIRFGPQRCGAESVASSMGMQDGATGFGSDGSEGRPRGTSPGSAGMASGCGRASTTAAGTSSWTPWPRGTTTAQGGRP